MQATTYNQKGEKSGTIELPKDLFEVKLNPDLVYQVAVTQMANRRQGTAHTKNRGEVSGGGKKPWKQKGTGRSRHGSSRTPIWRHGGVVFGPRNDKIYGGRLNKKMRRSALAMALSAKVGSNALIMMDSLELEGFKTREMALILQNLRKNVNDFKEGTVLIALPEFTKNTILACRNEAAKLNTLDLLNVKYVVMPVKSIDVIPRLEESGDKIKKAKVEKTEKPAGKTKSAKAK